MSVITRSVYLYRNLLIKKHIGCFALVVLITGLLFSNISTAMFKKPSQASGQSSPESKYKTELCENYQQTGNCSYGTKCRFAHGENDLKHLSQHPKYKTKLCKKYHNMGRCPYGKRCKFIHDLSENQQTSQIQRNTSASNGSSSALTWSGITEPQSDNVLLPQLPVSSMPCTYPQQPVFHPPASGYGCYEPVTSTDEVLPHQSNDYPGFPAFPVSAPGVFQTGLESYPPFCMPGGQGYSVIPPGTSPVMAYSQIPRADNSAITMAPLPLDIQETRSRVDAYVIQASPVCMAPELRGDLQQLSRYYHQTACWSEAFCMDALIEGDIWIEYYDMSGMSAGQRYSSTWEAPNIDDRARLFLSAFMLLQSMSTLPDSFVFSMWQQIYSLPIEKPPKSYAAMRHSSVYRLACQIKATLTPYLSQSSVADYTSLQSKLYELLKSLERYAQGPPLVPEDQKHSLTDRIVSLLSSASGYQ